MRTATIAVLVLEPDAVQHDALAAYVANYAEAGNWLARRITDAGITDQVRLHRLYYGELRSRFGLPAQTVVLMLKHVARLCRRSADAPELTWAGPVPYDKHLFSLKAVDRVSLATLTGRVVVPCTLASYQRGEFVAGSGELRFEEDQWLFCLRTSLPEPPARLPQREQETDMSDRLLNRISRLISGVTHNALAQAEQAVSIPVMEQAIRDIDAAVKEVRTEIGQAEATKYNVAHRIAELQREHEQLNDKIAVALKEDKEGLAEAGAGRQIDIENQLKLLQRTIADSDQDISKLSDSLQALQASRREAQQRLRDIKTVPTFSTQAAGASGGSATAKAAQAIESAQQLGESFTGVPADESHISSKDLEDLAELHRQNAVRERLAKHKASLKGGT